MEEQQALTVSQALAVAKGQLEGFTLHIIGEVSSFKDSGNWSAVYFSIGDKNAVLNCLMWKGPYESSGLNLKDGMLVEVVGKFNIYPKKGTMSFSVSRIEPAGEGVLRAAVAERLARLQREGLTDEAIKKDLPQFPRKIGVITSPQGKVIHDVLRTFRRRYPLAEILFFGTKVEGDDAPESLAHALDVADSSGCDVLLLVRGGGSYEDLLPFSSDEVAYAIARSQTPIISGVGHEPDVTIADYVADRRASTPTAAAELAVPDCVQLQQHLSAQLFKCSKSLETTLETQRNKLALLEARNVLSDPYYLLYVPGQNIDNLRTRLDGALPQLIKRDRHKSEVLRARFLAAGNTLLDKPRYTVASQASRLEDLSPLKVLTRGYAAVFDKEHTVISRVEEVAVGQDIDVMLLDGTIACKVDAIRHNGGLS